MLDGDVMLNAAGLHAWREAQGVNAPACRAAAALGLLLLAACASPPPRDHPPGTGRPAPVSAATREAAPLVTPAQNDAAANASFDWHPLVVAPFGTLLKDSPIRLHEVLLFHDERHGPTEIESKDCYAVEGTPPTFVGQAPDEYLMCFEHDRLDRIDASVRLAADDAALIFGRACALWLGNAQPLTKADDACEGRDGDIAFSARLAAVPGENTAELLMTLSDAAKSDAAKTEAEPEPATPRDPGSPPSAAP
jgi:hypothetical protein